MERSSQRWTAQQRATLTELFEAGLNDEEISRQVNRTPMACAQQRGAAGLVRHNTSRWTPERDAVLRALHADGLSFGQIAHELNCNVSRNSCVGRAHRLGLMKRARRERRTESKVREPVNRAVVTGNITEKANNARRKAKKAKTKNLPPEIITEIPIASDFLSIPFLDLQPSMCRYPQGEGLAMLFCGQPHMEGHSYCPHCYQFTHAPTRMLTLSNEERARRRRHGLRIMGFS